MKKNVVLFFFKSLFKSIFIIVSILAVGVVSYKFSFDYLSRQAEEGKLDVQQQELESILQQAQKDELSKNLIYVADDQQRISHMMLEICNTNTYNMDYITIPVRAEYTIPTKMYQKLCVVDEEIPQIVRLARLRQYFSDLGDKEAYGYAELIMEKLLDIEISYYTVISQDVYKSDFCQKKVTTRYTKIPSEEETADNALEQDSTAAPQKKKTSVTMKVSMVDEYFQNQVIALGGDAQRLMDFIKEQYDREGVFSNLTVYNKIGYLEAYQKMSPQNYHYWGLPGSYTDTLFEIDAASATHFIHNLERNSKTYTKPQDFGKAATGGKKISSKGKDLLLLNGSRISGLAASMRDELTSAGFNVTKIGDYTQEILTKTRIMVPKNGMGNDLAKYFKDPEIVVGDVEEGYDVEIILGTADANE